MTLLKELMQLFFASNRVKLVLVFLLTLIHQVLMLAPAVFLGKMITAFSTPEQPQLALYITLFFLSALLACIIWPLQLKHICHLYHSVSAAMGIRWCQDLLRREASFFFTNRWGEVIRAFDRGMQDFPWAQQCMVENILFNLLKLILILAYILSLGSVWILLVLILFIAINSCISAYIVHKKRPVTHQSVRAEENISASQAELISALKPIQFLGAWESAAEGLKQSFDEARRHEVRFTFLSSFLVSLSTITPGIFSFVLIFMGISLHVDLSSGDFVTLFIFSSQALQISLTMISTLSDLTIFHEHTQTFEQMRRQPLKCMHLPSPSLHHYNITIHPFRIPFIDNQQAALQCPTEISIPFGSKVAVIGDSGQGKTTLAHIIAGWRWRQGAISLGGHDLTTLNTDSLVNTLFFAEQESQFLHEGFEQAVLYGEMGHSRSDLKQLFSMLGLHHRLPLLQSQEFPKNDLSTGKKKCLALMRAMVLKRPITLLDEPTESLGQQQAATVWQHVMTAFADHTLICLTHHQDLLTDFDMVLEIKDHIIRQKL